LNKVLDVVPAVVLGLMTIVATRQLGSVVLAAQSSPPLPPVPSSHVMKTAVVPLVYSELFRIVGRLLASQCPAHVHLRDSGGHKWHR
jgi:hypothetical protein